MVENIYKQIFCFLFKFFHREELNIALMYYYNSNSLQKHYKTI